MQQAINRHIIKHRKTRTKYDDNNYSDDDDAKKIKKENTGS